ncbi:MAG: c-type cytochrome [Labilithrix sp.]|nr:c-type cytochrome [Labilithrix sp.]
MNRWWKVTPLLAVVVGIACNTKGNENLEESRSAPIAPTPGPQPTFKTTASLPSSPPAISGGTLAVAGDGRTAVAADPDRDRVYVVDVPSRAVKHSIKLAERSEPGRVAIDTKGRAHVALRNSGNIATIDLATGAVTERRACVAPRGIAYDADLDTLHVACAEGFLVSIPLAGGDIRRIGLDRDVRDVMITKNNILVSRFREADVLVLSRAGALQGKSTTRGGNLGWRIAKAPTAPADDEQTSPPEESDEPAMISQEPVDPSPTPGAVGYYGSGATDACSAPTITATRLDIPGEQPIFVPPAVLPVDLATNGREYAIVAAGNGHTSSLPQLFVHRVRPRATDASSSSSGFGGSSGSSGFGGGGRFGSSFDCTQMAKGFLPGQAVAAAYDGEDQLLVQSREPAALYIMTPDRQRVWKEIALDAESREDTGHAIFHSNSGGFLACASCHAEGGEDGRTWEFIEGPRRTPSMRGTIADTAPFHWDGTMTDMRHLVDHVFSTRMSGPKVDDAQVETLKTWLFKVPAPPKLEQDAAAVERGQVLFTQRGCATCHSGKALTNNETRDVGTGGAFQVPSLVGVAWRAPFIHNGCAKTMKDRFDGLCGGDKHGDIAGMTSAQIADLSTYVESL